MLCGFWRSEGGRQERAFLGRGEVIITGGAVSGRLTRAEGRARRGLERLGPVSRSLEDTRQAAAREWTFWEAWIRLYIFPQISHLPSPFSVSKFPHHSSSTSFVAGWGGRWAGRGGRDPRVRVSLL